MYRATGVLGIWLADVVYTCRPSGALCYAYSLFYIHVAPLGLRRKAIRFLYRHCAPLERAPLGLNELMNPFPCHVSFPLKLRLSLLHERLPALLIVLTGETGIH